MNDSQHFQQFPYELVDLILEKFLFEQVVCTSDIQRVMGVLKGLPFLTQIVSSKITVAIFLEEGTPFSKVKREVLQYCHFTNSIYLMIVTDKRQGRATYVYDLQGQGQGSGMKFQDFLKRRKDQYLSKQKRRARLLLSTTYDCHIFLYSPRARLETNINRLYYQLNFLYIPRERLYNHLNFIGWDPYGLDIVWPKYFNQKLCVISYGGSERLYDCAYPRNNGDLVSLYNFSQMLRNDKNIDEVIVAFSRWHLVRKKKSWTERIFYAIKRRAGRNSSVNTRDRKITEIGHILSLLRAQLNIK